MVELVHLLKDVHVQQVGLDQIVEMVSTCLYDLRMNNKHLP